MFDKLKAQYLEELAAKPKSKINVTLPDGKIIEGLSWESTPYEIARGIAQGLADSTVVAKVNGELWDLDRPLEGDCSLKLLKFDDKEAEAVFWHSSAHILGEAMERVRIISTSNNALLMLSIYFSVMVVIYAMDHQLRMVSTTICSSKVKA